MRISSRAVLIGAAMAAAWASRAVAQRPGAPPRSTCSGNLCAETAKGELFVAAFAASASTPGLRAAVIRQAEGVIMSFQGVEGAHLDFAAGKISAEERDNIIDGWALRIRSFMDQSATEANMLAATGQYSGLAAISKTLGELLAVAVQDVFHNREELAGIAQKKLVGILTMFSEQFAATCDQQVFPVEFAVGLGRQNEMLGTNASVLHCARRKRTVDISSLGVNYHLETCTSHQESQWALTIGGKVEGTGTADGDSWDATATYQGRTYNPTGLMEIFSETVIVKEQPVPSPDDIGPNGRRNGRPQEPIPLSQLYPTVKFIPKARITTIELAGDHGIDGWTTNRPFVDGVIVESEKPCK